MLPHRPSKTLKFYLEKIDGAVDRALNENPDAEIILLAHSIGGEDTDDNEGYTDSYSNGMIG